MGKSEQCALPERYKIIPRVLVFPISQDKKILLIQGSASKKIWPGKWNGIGGHVEVGENILDAAKRELHEETGLSSKDWVFCGTILVDVGETLGIGIFVFKAGKIEGTLGESIEGKPEWLDFDKINDLELVEDLHYLLPRIEKFNQGDDPIWGFYHYDPAGQLIMEF